MAAISATSQYTFRLSINLTPLIPLSLKERGKEFLERGLLPPLSLHSPCPYEGKGVRGIGC
jgi:hypothetical protein